MAERAKALADQIAPTDYERTAVAWKRIPKDAVFTDNELALIELLNRAYRVIAEMEDDVAAIKRETRHSKKSG